MWKLCKFADVYDKPTLHKICIGEVDPSVYHSRKKYWTTHPHPDITNFALKVLLPLLILNDSQKLLIFRTSAAPSKLFAWLKWRKEFTNVVEVVWSSSREHPSTWRKMFHSRSKTFPVIVSITPKPAFTQTNTSSSFSTVSSLSTHVRKLYCHY